MLPLKKSEKISVDTAVQYATRTFTERGISTPRLDAELIISHFLGVTRENLYLIGDRVLTDKQCEDYFRAVKKRCDFYPIPYITGKKEFYSLNFFVNESVLIPRPETELLVEEAVLFFKTHGKDSTAEFSLLEIGTGSGAVAVALSSELPRIKIVATDISREALMTASRNISHHEKTGQVTLLCSHLFRSLKKGGKFHGIVANPPYVDSNEMNLLPPDVLWEPRFALHGGDGGIEFIEEIITDSPDYLVSGGGLIIEIGNRQKETVKEIITRSGKLAYSHTRVDYAGHYRVIVAKRI
jgi:release factor glutamine methyltransferase